ncbi:MAG: response regulator [Planctomycetota bacterium]
MASRFYFKSVRARQVFWFLVVAMVPMFTVVAILYYQRAAAIKGREFEKLQTIRDLKVREFNGWLDERIGDLKVAAADHNIRGLERVLAKKQDERTPEDVRAISAAREVLRRYVDSYDAYDELFIVCANRGTVDVSSEHVHEGRDESKNTYFTEPMRMKDVYVKDIHYSKTDGAPAMTFSAPVFCLEHKDEHIIGVVVARIDLDHSLYPLLQERTGSGKTGETLIVNKNCVALNELRWHENAPLELRISAESGVRAANGETGVTETPDYRGEMVLAAYTHIPRTGWGFVAKRDLAEVYAPIRAMVWNMGGILAVSALIVSATAVFLGRAVTRPVVAIAEAARRVQEGNLAVRCEAGGADEVAGLANAVNDMADTLTSQVAVQTGGAELARTAAAASSVGDFASGLVTKLMGLTGSNIGAYYQRSQDGLAFEPVTSVGLKAEALQSFDAGSREGEFGEALASGSICYTGNISAETVFTFKAVAGTAMPREIATVPLLAGRRAHAIISLATLGEYTDEHRQILEQAWIVLNTALAKLLASEKTEHMAEELQVANEELQATNEELQSQAEELRQQAEELEVQRRQVEEADRLKSEFLANMSHELRTPLNSVMALSQLMISRGLGKDLAQEAEYLRVIERNGRQLLELINDVLDLSKIEAGRQEVILSEFEPRKLAEAAVATARPLAAQKSLTVAVRIADDVPAVHSDRDKVRQILLNLLSNAVKFTETGGIGVTVSAAAGGVAFAVTDTGLGIAETDLEHIFDEFRQLDGSTTRKHGGTGLGLTISQRLARLLGGQIAVTSEPGKGSTFTLTLPPQCPAGTSGRAPAAEGRPRPGAGRRAALDGRPHILVVEDNEIAAMQIQAALEENGCEVTVAAGGAEGLEAVRQRMPDAMVLDLMMPGVDGFEVLDQIRSMPETEQLPVLVLTAKELTAEDHARLRYNNVQELVQKGSLNRDELVGCVDRLFEGAAPAAGRSDEQPAEPEEKTCVIPAVPAGTTVLVVEDDPDHKLTITAIHDEKGAGHMDAESAERAVQMARKARPGLILMDIQLPALSGLDAARQIKADPDLEGIPVIALTAMAMAGDREAILAAGCDDYVSKPINAAALGETIRKWLAEKGGEGT